MGSNAGHRLLVLQEIETILREQRCRRAESG
jgi:hypothetical protein